MNLLIRAIAVVSMATPAIAASASWRSEAPAPIQLVCNAKENEGARTKCYADSYQRFTEQKLSSSNTRSSTSVDASKICATLGSADERTCLSFYKLQSDTTDKPKTNSAAASTISQPAPISTSAGSQHASGDQALQALFNGSGGGAAPVAPADGSALRALMNDQIAEEQEQARQRELERQQEELHQKQLAAEHAAVENAQRIAQAQADAAREQAANSSDDDTGSMLMGLAFGGLVGKAMGSSQLASQAAAIAGVDPTAASLGAGMAIQQQQQAAAALAQIKEQQQALAAKIAAAQAAQREAEQQRAAQIAAQQIQPNQQRNNIVVAQLPAQQQPQSSARPSQAVQTPTRSGSSATLYAGDGPNGNENPTSCITANAGSEHVYFTNSCQNTNVEVDVCGIRTRGPNEYGMADRSSRGAITLYHQGLTGNSGFWEFRSDGANPGTSYVWSASYCRVQPNFLNGVQNCPAACPSDPSPDQGYAQNSGSGSEPSQPQGAQPAAQQSPQQAPQQAPPQSAPSETPSQQ
jgi:hypothetical protein